MSCTVNSSDYISKFSSLSYFSNSQEQGTSCSKTKHCTVLSIMFTQAFID